MIVAGDHANNDMAGEDADSWRTMMPVPTGRESSFSPTIESVAT